MALNLAQTLKQEKVIKRNMNCDASEKWQIPSETKDVNVVEVRLLNVLLDAALFYLCGEKNRNMAAIGEMGLYDTTETKCSTNPQYFINYLLLYRELEP